jgi:nucleoside 2-deoxyribosyltransferase
MSLTVYIAAPYPARRYAQAVMRLLELEDIGVTSTWLTQDEDTSDATARLDLADVARADVLVALNEPEYSTMGTGGRHVEFGYALALGKPIVLVGVRTNVFHFLRDLHHCEIDTLVATLRGIAFRRSARA